MSVSGPHAAPASIQDAARRAVAATTMTQTTHTLMTRLFSALDQHEHTAMADCYAENARFTDIAFDLHGRRQIHAMWHMISEGDIRTTFTVERANEREGLATVTDDYTFRSTGRHVRNAIQSHFVFENGLIVEQRDECDPGQWGQMAIGGIGGFIAGHVGFVRRRKAGQTLQAFLDRHPEYR